MANLVNLSLNYLAAIQLVQVQIGLLEQTNIVRPDGAVEQDLELLQSYYAILFDQAKTMNMLQ